MRLNSNVAFLLGLGVILAVLGSIIMAVALLIAQPFDIPLRPRRNWMEEVSAVWLLATAGFGAACFGLLWLNEGEPRATPKTAGPSPKSPARRGAAQPVWVFPMATTDLCRRIDADGDEAAALEALKRYEQGKPLAADDLPIRFILRSGRAPADIMLSGFFFVSASVADVLRRFDLGENRLILLDSLHTGRDATPLPQPFFLLTLENRKTAFDPDHCNQRAIRQIAEGVPFWQLYLADFPNDSWEVTPDALSGPDLWCDPATPRLLYLSDRLKNALDVHGIGQMMETRRCRITPAAP